MSKTKSLICPVAIDLGARHTGVFLASYEEGTDWQDIRENAEGAVYSIDTGSDSYTYMMTTRTAKRHQRRGHDRRQKAKRLFKLIWRDHFNLKWNKDVEQTISFLLNRRGFTYLTEEAFCQDYLTIMTIGAKRQLGEVLDIKHAEERDFSDILDQWIDNGGGAVKEQCNKIVKFTKNIGGRKVLIDITGQLFKHAESLLSKKNGDDNQEASKGNTGKGRQKKNTLSSVNAWIIKEWIANDIPGLPDLGNEKSADIIKHLEELGITALKKLCRSTASTQYLDKIKEENESIKKNPWNFNFDGGFTLDEFEKATTEEKETKAHIRHFAQALYQAEFAGCHRSEYFEEIYKVLKFTNHKHDFLSRFCHDLHSKRFEIHLAGQPTHLTPETLINLVGHISNLELNPLRKYFNDRSHAKKDQWLLLPPDDNWKNRKKNFTYRYKQWVLSDWRVDENHKQKGKGQEYDYWELRKALDSSNPNKTGFNLSENVTLIDFMLKVKPDWTIPPYQSKNNRKPPHCQSLILNVQYLRKHYPKWTQWVDILKSLESVTRHVGISDRLHGDIPSNYEQSLLNMKSGNGKSYFSKITDIKDSTTEERNKILDARVLQFILDRVQDEDTVLSLNKIFGCAKKFFQVQSANKDDASQELQKLIDTIEKSKLPPNLTSGFNKQTGSFETQSFLHLVYNYYRTRQKARQGRIFIQPIYQKVKDRGLENTGRFYDKDHLMTYCNQKPRQKNRQMLVDIADALQVSPQTLQKHIGGDFQESQTELLTEWLDSFKIKNGKSDIELRKLCEKAAKEQKSKRGEFDSNSPLVRDAKEMNIKMMSGLLETDNMARLQDRLEHNPIAAAFLLAKLHNIAFQNRSGYSRTCPVCSMDNALRMKQIPSVATNGLTAQSQRLPAISTRVFDGAVRLMALRVCSWIADDIWKKIEKPLKEETRVRVPIIIESNRFEFDGAVNRVLKGRKDKTEDTHGDVGAYNDKRERIRVAGRGTCPYADTQISANTSDNDFDHIIPRTSPWGTLNDEANLIYASQRGNRAVKGNNPNFTLSELNPNYKHQVLLDPYNLKNDDDIVKWIESVIGNGKSEYFTFGKYNSFTRLTPEQQVAFRHSLFLVGHPLRDRVIEAINHRNKTLVNGTQRYFADTLARRLYKKAMALKNSMTVNNSIHLSFDYYEIKARSDSPGDGIHDLRKMYEEAMTLDLQEFTKIPGEPQKMYSHLIDAQLAFVIAAYSHRNDPESQNRGGMGIHIDDTLRKEPFDPKTGEWFGAKGMLNYLLLPENQFKKVDVRRRPLSDHFSTHRAFTKDTFIADHYFPILMKRENGKVRAKIGLEWENNSVDMIRGDLKALPSIIHLFKGVSDLIGNVEYGNIDELFAAMEKSSFFRKQLHSNGFAYLAIDKKKLHEYWIENYNTKSGNSFNQFDGRKFIFNKLCYCTVKKQIKEPEDIDKYLDNLKNFQTGKITIWAKAEWKSLQDAWKQSRNKDFGVFLRTHFQDRKKKDIQKGNQSNKQTNRQHHAHQKARNTFSLPILVTDKKILIRRKSWNDEMIYQIMNDADHREGHNSMLVPVRTADGSIAKRLAHWAKSKNIVKFKDDTVIEGDDIDPNQWWKVVSDGKNVNLPKGIDTLWYQITNVTSPLIAIKLSMDGKKLKQLSFLDKPICKHAGTKNRDEDEARIKASKKGDIICYKGSKIINSNPFKNAFRTAIPVDKPE